MKRVLIGIAFIFIFVGCSAEEESSDLDKFIKNYNEAISDEEEKIDSDDLGEIEEDDLGPSQRLYSNEELDIFVSYDSEENIGTYNLMIHGEVDDGIGEAKAIVKALDLDLALFEKELETIIDSDEMFHHYADDNKNMTFGNMSEADLFMIEFREEGFEE